jgi:zinc protease
MSFYILLARFSLLITFMTAIAQDSQAQTAATPLPTVAFEKTILPNGLQVILVEDKRLPIVAVNRRPA